MTQISPINSASNHQESTMNIVDTVDPKQENELLSVSPDFQSPQYMYTQTRHPAFYNETIPDKTAIIINGEIDTFPTAAFKAVRHKVEENSLLKFAGFIFYDLFCTLLFIPFVILIAIAAFIIYVIRLLLRIRGSWDTMSYLNHNEIIWFFTKQPILVRLDVNKGLKFNKLKEILNRRVVSAETREGDRKFPRFSQRIISCLSGFAWCTDTTFTIDDHVAKIIPPLKTNGDIAIFLSDLSSRPFDIERPMWDIHYQSCFGDSQDALVILRIHPSICDGFSLVQLLCAALCDDQTALPMPVRFSSSNYLFSIVRSILTAPLVFLTKYVFDGADYNMLHDTVRDHQTNNDNVGNNNPSNSRMYLQRTMCLKAIKRTKQITRSTFNDLFFNLVTGGLRAYQQVKGITNPFDCRIVLPIQLSSKNLTVNFGHDYVLTDVTIPVNIEGTIPRLWKVRERMKRFKSSTNYRVQNIINKLLCCCLPAKWASRFARSVIEKSSCFVTNLQGPDYQLWLDSKEIHNISYWYPNTDKVHLALSFFTYADQLSVSLTADQRYLPDPEFLLQMVVRQMESFEKLLENRRIPGESRIAANRARSHGASSSSTIAHAPIMSTPNRPVSAVISIIPNNNTSISKLPTEEESINKELQTISYDDLQLRLASAQLKLQDPDGVSQETRDALKLEFIHLMTELRRRKATIDNVDFDDMNEHLAPRRKVSLVSLRSFTVQGSRRRSATHGLFESDGDLRSTLTVTAASRRVETSWDNDP